MHLDVENISPSYSIISTTVTAPIEGRLSVLLDTAASYIHMYFYVHFPN